MSLVETAIALAVDQAGLDVIPAVLIARTGDLIIIDSSVARSPNRVAILHDEAAAYRDEWMLSA